MKKTIPLGLLLFLFTTCLFAQPNCLAFRYYGDTLKYEACTIGEAAYGLYQFSKEFHEIFDQAIEMDPTYDYAYRSKSVSYLKSGDFINWKILMDKAVAINPTEHLGYRGWSHFQFFRDYENAIKDIELLDSLLSYDIGYSKNGNYHLQVARALCYKQLGQNQKAATIIEQQLATANYSPGIYDYLHLGVLYLHLNQFDQAHTAFARQSEINELAENQYYLGLLYQQQGKAEAALQSFNKAHSLYLEEIRLYDTYTHPVDQVYLRDIEDAIK